MNYGTEEWMDILWAIYAAWFTYWCLHQIKSLLKAGFHSRSSLSLYVNINVSRKLKLNRREVCIRVETFGIRMWYIKIKKAYVVSKRCKMSQVWIFFIGTYSHTEWAFLCRPEPSFWFRFFLCSKSNFNLQSNGDIFKVFYTNMKLHARLIFDIF